MILVALGTNLSGRFDTPVHNIEAALAAMNGAGMRIVSSSRIFVSAPVPASDQPDYYNAVARVDTVLEPQDLLRRLHAIEREMGRVRDLRNAARTLDLDLLAYNDSVIMQDDIYVPHLRMAGRAFVLLPLRDVAPQWVHPVSKKFLCTMIAELESSDLKNCYPLVRSAA